jgi:hypothetical protein
MIMADLILSTTADLITMVVDTIEVVERVKVVHKLKHLTTLHNKEQNHGELRIEGN